MTAFRTLLIALFSIMMIYTLIVIFTDGMNFLGVFLSDIFSLTWPGQFNLDFAGYLLLSALWILWRNGFAPGAWPIAAAAGILGMPVFSAYLLVLLGRHDGDLSALLLGVHHRSA